MKGNLIQSHVGWGCVFHEQGVVMYPIADQRMRIQNVLYRSDQLVEVALQLIVRLRKDDLSQDTDE